MNYYIVTGTSSGIGEAIARKLILDRHKVFCISRRLNESLTDLAASVQSGLWYFETDLGEPSNIPRVMKEIFSFVDPDNIQGIALINNAGILDPIAPAGDYEPGLVHQHLSVNLLAPVLLANEFIRYTRPLKTQKSIISISSGAATTPYEGWGIYCSSKAGLDMFTRTVALEQQQIEYPVRILSVAPGIVDTPMQGKIRQSDMKDFPMRAKFEKLYTENKLSRPAEVAEKIIRLIFGNTPPSGEIADLRNL